MKSLFLNTNFNFLKWRKIFLTASSIIFLSSIIWCFVLQRINFGIEFTGGILMQILFSDSKEITPATLRKILNENNIFPDLQTAGTKNEFLLRIKGSQEILKQQSERILSILNQSFSNGNIVVRRTEYIGPTIGKFLIKKAWYAISFSLIGIIVYVGFRFRNLVWGISGVVALIHDVLITLGIISVLNKELTLNVVAALLTIAGFSINDTIVIFDRVRENLRILKKISLYEILNRSINETLSRTIITTLTALLAVIALFLFGGNVIHDFSFTLLVGFIIGTYSTIYIASPIVYLWYSRKK